MAQREDVGSEGVRAIQPLKIFSGPTEFADAMCRLENPSPEDVGTLFVDDDWYYMYESKFFRSKREAVNQLVNWASDDVMIANTNRENALKQFDLLINTYEEAL
jgi:hypothetical protein